MASFVRLAARHTRVLTASAMRCRTPTTHMRLISTSENKKDDMATAVERSFYPPTIKPEDDLRNKEENWLSFGYDETDQEEDYFAHHMSMFCIVTIITCLIPFIFAYMPDFKLQDWSVREAHLELARREKLGLPLVDPNLIDPARIQLPSDEELGDTEIII